MKTPFDVQHLSGGGPADAHYILPGGGLSFSPYIIPSGGPADAHYIMPGG